jgi:hypothetical protein
MVHVLLVYPPHPGQLLVICPHPRLHTDAY